MPSLDQTGIDLLSQMLHYEPWHRITARVAVQHPYFDDIAQLFAQQTPVAWVCLRLFCMLADASECISMAVLKLELLSLCKQDMFVQYLPCTTGIYADICVAKGIGILLGSMHQVPPCCGNQVADFKLI